MTSPRHTPAPARSWLARSLIALLVTLLLVPLLAACDRGTPSTTLRVLAGSELKDLQPILDDMEKQTGVRLELQYLGTLEGADRIAAGDTSDLAWFSHGKYLTLVPETAGRVVAQERIMLSPVVMGVRKSVADAFGWTGDPSVTWADIAAKAAAGQLRYAMTNPTASNSGFTALVGVAAALSGSSDALQVGDIDQARLTQFFSGQALTAGSSGFLADAYVEAQDRLDGMINYESILLSLDRGGTLNEPLELIYPREGIITADYPLMLLDASKREAFDKVTTWLRSPDVQRRIMDTTARRPAIPDVPLSAAFPTASLVELPFPATLDVIDALLFAYLDVIKVPASAVFVIDVSGSMDGDRLESLKAALDGLTGMDPTLTGRFARFRAREQITILAFNDTIADERTFTIDDTAPDGPDMRAIRAYVDSLEAGGNTAIFSALDRAYDIVALEQAADPSRYYTVVVMTDGENNSGMSRDDFLARLAARPDLTSQVRTYAVKYGEADASDLQAIADATRGRVFDASAEGLQTIFKQIRGYQ